MEDRFEISLLLDYYGSLLTEKQQDIMTMYYNDDLSLAEISEINNTSRQAIHDLLKRCYKQLLAYEEKLKLLEKGNIKKEKRNKLINDLKVKYELQIEIIDYIDNVLEDIING
ncbi:UPF0122 protein [Clostridium polyendosporum]|uniref:UPF0122 protein CPJCM30710_04960 n=1 Tax=Clostridium polyendosporum TaxID=69208 RepID=A0A919RWN0_9CLOT|nr:putative DNA-binding protein [Clostridium polyendosporum]GIM27830.1 UPF0122 protein [Clostridium polyendosporum]